MKGQAPRPKPGPARAEKAARPQPTTFDNSALFWQKPDYAARWERAGVIGPSAEALTGPGACAPAQSSNLLGRQSKSRDFPQQRKGMAGNCYLSVNLETAGLEMDQIFFFLLSLSLSQMFVQPHCWALLHATSLRLWGPSPLWDRPHVQGAPVKQANWSPRSYSPTLQHPPLPHEGSASIASGMVQP